MALGGLKHGGRDGEQRSRAQHSDLEPPGKLHAGLRLSDDLVRDVRVFRHSTNLAQSSALVHGAEPCLP